VYTFVYGFLPNANVTYCGNRARGNTATALGANGSTSDSTLAGEAWDEGQMEYQLVRRVSPWIFI
jgi:hypothetical protein